MELQNCKCIENKTFFSPRRGLYYYLRCSSVLQIACTLRCKGGVIFSADDWKFFRTWLVSLSYFPITEKTVLPFRKDPTLPYTYDPPMELNTRCFYEWRRLLAPWHSSWRLKLCACRDIICKYISILEIHEFGISSLQLKLIIAQYWALGKNGSSPTLWALSRSS